MRGSSIVCLSGIKLLLISVMNWVIISQHIKYTNSCLVLPLGSKSDFCILTHKVVLPLRKKCKDSIFYLQCELIIHANSFITSFILHFEIKTVKISLSIHFPNIKSFNNNNEEVDACKTQGFVPEFLYLFSLMTYSTCASEL